MIQDERVDTLLRDFNAIIASATTAQLYILDEVQAIIDERRNELQEEIDNDNQVNEESTTGESEESVSSEEAADSEEANQPEA